MTRGIWDLGRGAQRRGALAGLEGPGTSSGFGGSSGGLADGGSGVEKSGRGIKEGEGGESIIPISSLAAGDGTSTLTCRGGPAADISGSVFEPTGSKVGRRLSPALLVLTASLPRTHVSLAWHRVHLTWTASWTIGSDPVEHLDLSLPVLLLP